MTAYYNENDPKAAAWLRELIADGLIAQGDVDERSIVDVKGSDLDGYRQVHLFSGIGGWSYALRFAGVADDFPIWTGSCPCQPFSGAGKRLGEKDPRHLWPEMFRLIRECRPDRVIGEQVEAAIRLGWLDGIFGDLEGEGYACGAIILGAHSVGAPHIRQRLYWMAESENGGLSRRRGTGRRDGGEITDDCEQSRLADAEHAERGPSTKGRDDDNGDYAGRDQAAGGLGACGETDGGMGHAPRDDERRIPVASMHGQRESVRGSSGDGGMGDTDAPRLEIGQGHQDRRGTVRIEGATATTTGPWDNSRWIAMRDGKARRIPTEPLFSFTFNGLSGIMGPCWDKVISQIKKEIERHAHEIQIGPGKILRTMWNFAASETIRQHLGGHDTIPEPEILLIALFKLAWSTQSEFHTTAQDFSEIQEGTLRLVWEHADQFGASSCPSYQWGLEGSPTGESSNPLRWMPSEPPQSGTRTEVQILRNKIPPSWNVPKALSAMEEIWRSFLDEGANNGDLVRLRSDTGIIKAMDGFPLAGQVPGRVMLLRGYGNAIVPQVAAEFLRACFGAKE